MNIVLNVKQKQEWIMSTLLRLIKSLEVAPMNMACFGGKEVLRGVRPKVQMKGMLEYGFLFGSLSRLELLNFKLSTF